MRASTPRDERLLAIETRGDLRELVGRFDDAISDYRQALDLARADPERAARLHRKIGVVYQRRGAYAEADAALRKALELHGDTPDAERGRVELALGQTASRRGEYDVALNHFQRAHEILTDAPDRDDLALAEAQYSSGMGHYWIAMREPAKERIELEAARKDYLACLETRKRLGDQLGMRPALNMLATTYAQVQDYAPAVESYYESIRIRERAGGLPGIAN